MMNIYLNVKKTGDIVLTSSCRYVLTSHPTFQKSLHILDVVQTFDRGIFKLSCANVNEKTDIDTNLRET